MAGFDEPGFVKQPEGGSGVTLAAAVTAAFGALASDASDGNATLDGAAAVGWASRSGSTYTMTADCFVGALVVDSGVILVTNGFRVFARTVSNAGTIHDDGAAGVSNGNAGAARSAGTLSATIAGGAGGTAGGSNGSNTGTVVLPSSRSLGNTYKGGSGGTGSGGSGGTTGTVTALAATRGSLRGGAGMVAANPLSQVGALQATFGAGGGGGGGDGTAGGGGGAGGGCVYIMAGSVSNTGTIRAAGGAGGTPAAGNRGGGGGGGGGLVIVICGVYSGDQPTAPGGALGAKSGTGTDGAVGNDGVVIVSNAA